MLHVAAVLYRVQRNWVVQPTKTRWTKNVFLARAWRLIRTSGGQAAIMRVAAGLVTEQV